MQGRWTIVTQGACRCVLASVGLRHGAQEESQVLVTYLSCGGGGGGRRGEVITSSLMAALISICQILFPLRILESLTPFGLPTLRHLVLDLCVRGRSSFKPFTCFHHKARDNFQSPSLFRGISDINDLVLFSRESRPVDFSERNFNITNTNGSKKNANIFKS